MKNAFSNSQLMQTLMDGFPGLVSYVDRDLVYRFMNDAYESWFGINKADFLGKRISDLVGPDALAAVMPYIQNALNGKNQEFQQNLRYKNGEIRHAGIKYYPDIDTNGKVLGLFALVTDLSQSELAKRANDNQNRQLNRIFGAINVAIAYFDYKLVNRYANLAYTSILGMKPEDIKDKALHEFLGDDLFTQSLPNIKKVLQGQPQVFERNFRSKISSSEQSLLIHYTPDFDGDNIVGFFISFTDITKVKQAELESLQQKEFFSNISNHMQEGFAVQDQDAHIKFFNTVASKILGLTPDQLLGRTSLDPRWQAIREDGSPFPGDEHPAMVTIKTGKICRNVPMGIKIPDGRTRWLQVSSSPFDYNFEGKPMKVLVNFSDITDEHAKRRMLSGIALNLPGVLFQFRIRKEAGFGLSYISPKIQELFGISDLEALAHPEILLEMIHPDDKQDFLEAFDMSVKFLRPLDWHGRIIAKDGKVKRIFGRSFPQAEVEGSVLFDGLILDETKEIETQELLNQERSRMAHSSKLASLGEMSAGVAHEINNPLAIIAGMIALLKKPTQDPAATLSRIEKIEKAVVRIEKIVGGLKKFSRSESTSTKQAKDVSIILQEAINLSSIKARRFNTEVLVDIKASPMVVCDEIELEQVFINLVNNGIDAVKDANIRWVRVSLECDGHIAVIKIQDSGTGIPEHIAAKIFEPFFTTKPIGEGTGLGLSIVQGIVKDHGGEIKLVRGNLNTCFEIRFPVAGSIAEGLSA